MGRPSLLPAIAIVLAGLTVGTTGCGDDTGDIETKSTTTTEAEATTTTEADEVDTTETTEATDDTGESPFVEIDLGDELNPIEGYEYEPLPDVAREAMISAFASSAEVIDLVAAVGTTTVTSADGTSLLIFLGLNRELSETEQQDLVTGITQGGSELEEGEIAGQTGWAYVGPDGTQGFVTLRGDTVVIGQSDSSDHLAAVVNGLFTANPDL